MTERTRNQRRWNHRRGVLLGVIAIMALGSTLAAFADVPIWGIQIGAAVPVGNQVLVTVANTSTATDSAMISVQALVGDTPIWGRESVTLGAGGSATVAVQFPGTVQQVVKVVVGQ